MKMIENGTPLVRKFAIRMIKRKIAQMLVSLLMSVLAIGMISYYLSIFSGLFMINAVSSPSMAPAIHTGDLIIEQPADFDDVEVGDIITYRLGRTGTKVTHRVIEKDKENRTLWTKGDANNVKDAAAVQEEWIEGIVIYTVRYAGYPWLLFRK